MNVFKVSFFILFLQISSVYGWEDDNNIIDKFEKELKIIVTDYDGSLSAVKAFTKELKNKNSKYSISYSINSSNFLSEISIFLANQGIKDVEYKIVEIEDSTYDIRVIAVYQEVRDKNCSPSRMVNNKYKLGCTVEYNRIISLLNPSRDH